MLSYSSVLTPDSSLNDVVECYNKHSEYFSRPDEKGDYLLHTAIMNHWQYSVILEILRHNPHATMMLNHDGHLPLHLAAKFDEPAIIPNLLAIHPGACNVQSLAGDLPIHLAAENISSKEALQLLMSMCPPTVRQPDARGNLPLHRTISSSKQRFEIFLLLLEECPISIRVQNCDGNLPLHLIAESSKENRITYLCYFQMILTNYHDGSKVKNRFGDLPVHIACRNKPIHYVIKCLLSFHRRACDDVNANGKIPLHEAIEHHADFDTIYELVSAYPKSCCIPSSPNIYPMHVALQQHLDQRIIQFIAKSYPTSCMFNDSDGNLPIHLAIKQDIIDQKVVQVIASSYPQACMLEGSQGCKPLHLLLKSLGQDGHINTVCACIYDIVKCYPKAIFEVNAPLGDRDAVTFMQDVQSLSMGHSDYSSILRVLLNADPSRLTASRLKLQHDLNWDARRVMFRIHAAVMVESVVSDSGLPLIAGLCYQGHIPGEGLGNNHILRKVVEYL